MKILKKIISKITSGFFYIVDIETLKKYLELELQFSLENNLEASANLNIYINQKKHHILIWNYSASNFKEEQLKGLIIYYDDEEFKNLNDLYSKYLNSLTEYFKIELIDSDSTFLNEYKKNHPELKLDNYKE